MFKYARAIVAPNVAGEYIMNASTKSQENRDLVEAFIMYSPATLGATMALAYLNNAWDALDDYIGMVDDVPSMVDAMGLGDMSSMVDMVMNSVMSSVDSLMNIQAAYFLQNLSSVIQLLPSFAMLDTYHRASDIWILKDEDGNDIDSEDDLFEYYARRPWAWKYDEETGEVKVNAQIFPDINAIKESLECDVVSNEDVKKILGEVIKSVNKDIPLYKHIKDFSIRDTEFIKTTTQKIKRYKEIPNQ